MRKLFSIILLGLSFPAVATEPAMVLHSRGVSIRLQKTPCTATDVVVRIKPEMVGQFHAGTVVYRGKTYKACWTMLPETNEVLIVDDSGDHGTLPKSAFKPEESV